MKKGFFLLETLLAFALFVSIALPLLSLLLENQQAQLWTKRQEIVTGAFHNSLEIFFSGGYPEIASALEQASYFADTYICLDVPFQRTWTRTNPADSNSPMQILLTLTCNDGKGHVYESSVEFIFDQKKRNINA